LKALKDELAALNPAGASTSAPKTDKPKKEDDKKAKGGFTLKNAKVTWVLVLGTSTTLGVVGVGGTKMFLL
jgi:hypothetical protein